MEITPYNNRTVAGLYSQSYALKVTAVFFTDTDASYHTSYTPMKRIILKRPVGDYYNIYNIIKQLDPSQKEIL